MLANNGQFLQINIFLYYCEELDIGKNNNNGVVGRGGGGGRVRKVVRERMVMQNI